MSIENSQFHFIWRKKVLLICILLSSMSLEKYKFEGKKGKN